MQPKREILSIPDTAKWKKSQAYHDLIEFIHILCESVVGTQLNDEDIQVSENVQKLLNMINTLSRWVDEIPPVQQPQRFGNTAFRTWLGKVKENSKDLVSQVVQNESQAEELSFYLNDSFGNETRIDYGTGHEMSFAFFLLGLYKIGAFNKHDNKSIVLKLFNEYLNLARKLQVTYKMEPAGSHGVWSLDDFQFLPFIFGSAQLIGNQKIEPSKFVEENFIELHKDSNLFFSCLKFIISIKKGPFAEHSNQLWNISMVASWNKINSGLIKMYTAEVLDKFPVAQHILFGDLIKINQK
ncbi:unnamed protein product [Brachionus calyciflorus]|uniref:Serine/threonine-protein phosphatase 2A activator n=1 Tax=Brachionus calyciflorus TaxID=104777 RepID=A0A813PKC6_9BILA|nr:unnamed protein product [Brachionus calyciflorus]